MRCKGNISLKFVKTLLFLVTYFCGWRSAVSGARDSTGPGNVCSKEPAGEEDCEELSLGSKTQEWQCCVYNPPPRNCSMFWSLTAPGRYATLQSWFLCGLLLLNIFFERKPIVTIDYYNCQLVPCPTPLARPLCAVRACHNLRQSRAASRHIFGGKSLTTWCIKLHSIHQPSYYYCNTETTVYIVLSFHVTINGLQYTYTHHLWIKILIIPQTSYFSECNNNGYFHLNCVKRWFNPTWIIENI